MEDFICSSLLSARAFFKVDVLIVDPASRFDLGYSFSICRIFTGIGVQTEIGVDSMNGYTDDNVGLQVVAKPTLAINDSA